MQTLNTKNMKKQEKVNSETKRKRQRITLGSILEIPIAGEYYVYAQILRNDAYAFFDYRSTTPLRDLSVLEKAPVLWVLFIYDFVITQGIWQKVGKLPIREELQTLPMYYVHHQFDKLEFEIYDGNTGKMRPSTREEIEGLECAAIWADNHMEDRIYAHYKGLPCTWLSEHYDLFPDQRPPGEEYGEDKRDIPETKKKKEKASSETKKRGQYITSGSILELPIAGEYYVYAQILRNSVCAFFDYRSTTSLRDLSVLETAPVLWVLLVEHSVIRQGVWQKVGKLRIRKELQTLPKYYVYDSSAEVKYEIYDGNTVEIRPSTREEVEGLECGLIWANNHVEDRIYAHYKGVPCVWLRRHYELFPDQRPPGEEYGGDKR